MDPSELPPEPLADTPPPPAEPPPRPRSKDPNERSEARVRVPSSAPDWMKALAGFANRFVDLGDAIGLLLIMAGKFGGSVASGVVIIGQGLRETATSALGGESK